MSRDLRGLLIPSAVAVIGASERAGSVGGEILRNLVRHGYQGTLYPVNPKYSQLEGLRCYRDVSELPETDMAVIAVPRGLVHGVVEQCGMCGIRNLVIITAGFKEAGSEGAAQERALESLAKRHHLNIVGPNCMGIINSAPGVSMNASFSRWFPTPGGVAFISQSGSLGETLLELFEQVQLGVSLFVNLGNRVGLTENDFLEYLSSSDEVRVIFLYLESFADPTVFRTWVEVVSQAKPVVVLKAGRTEAGAAAVASHTGSLASSDAVVDALLRQSGAVRVSTVDEALTALRVLGKQPPPRGARAVILTNAGGAGILAADACERAGLDVIPLDPDTQAELRAFLPAEASVGNPVDMIATAGADDYEQALQTVLPHTDLAIVIFRPPLVLDESSKAVADAILRMAAATPRVPIVACPMSWSDEAVLFSSHLSTRGIPSFITPESAVDAASFLVEAARRVPRPHPRQAITQRDDLAEMIGRASREHRCGLTFEEGATILGAYGIDVCRHSYVVDLEQARGFVARSQYPVVLKLDAPELFHRFEHGAVVPGIGEDRSLAAGFGALSSLAEREEFSGARILIQEMLKGRELILGMKRDPVFGPVLMFGIGGTLVEVLKDVAFGIAPITPDQAMRMIRSIRAFPLLEAFRGQAAVDLDRLADTLVRIGMLSLELPGIAEIEVNPIIADADRAAAVDILIRIDTCGTQGEKGESP
ncbi:acetate--CoA ligase family protein [Candidatus Bipolaricaulota bacterium]|nr:acetate--CoA ligase family protein [Candidatus Bipolaricaulota bacterium]